MTAGVRVHGRKVLVRKGIPEELVRTVKDYVKKDLKKLDYLNLTDMDIRDLAEIEKFKSANGVDALFLSNNHITNISGLESFKKLKILFVTSSTELNRS